MVQVDVEYGNTSMLCTQYGRCDCRVVQIAESGRDFELYGGRRSGSA
jgi:hypothetical protein